MAQFSHFYLAIQSKLAGFTPEVSLRIRQVRKHEKGSTLALKPRADVTTSIKTEVSVASGKGLFKKSYTEQNKFHQKFSSVKP